MIIINALLYWSITSLTMNVLIFNDETFRNEIYDWVIELSEEN